jgi:hypothetical protein
MFWSVPRCFDGGTVAVLASGPSMSQAVADTVRAAGVPAIVVNATFRLAPWAWLLYGADHHWWTHEANRDALQFKGLKASVDDEVAPGVHRLRNSGVHGYDADPSRLRTGNNSGYQAVHIAAHTGAARILLCGFDLRDTRDSHWHGDHPWGLRRTGPATFDRWVSNFETLIPALAERGCEVVNCTPGSALRCQAADLEDALCLVQ